MALECRSRNVDVDLEGRRLFSPILEGPGSDGVVRALNLFLVTSQASPAEVSRGRFRIPDSDVSRPCGEGDIEISQTDLWTLASSLLRCPEVGVGFLALAFGVLVGRVKSSIPKATSGHLRLRPRGVQRSV